MRKRAADVRAKMAMETIDPQLNDDAFAKFDRMREKVEVAEAEAEALRELAGAAPSELAVGLTSDADHELDAELSALKRKMNK